MKVPATEGVPEMVIVFPAQEAETPVGKPVGVPIPVAPVVVCVKAVNAVLIQTGLIAGAAETVLSGVTVIVPVALTAPQPPARGME